MLCFTLLLQQIISVQVSQLPCPFAVHMHTFSLPRQAEPSGPIHLLRSPPPHFIEVFLPLIKCFQLRLEEPSLWSQKIKMKNNQTHLFYLLSEFDVSK